jgi:hypothetical protein
MLCGDGYQLRTGRSTASITARSTTVTHPFRVFGYDVAQASFLVIPGWLRLTRPVPEDDLVITELRDMKEKD